MKNFNGFILLLLLSLSFASTGIAKEDSMNMNDTSVQHLKKIVEEAKEIRRNDVPFEQVDISKDVSLTLETKEKFYKNYKIFELYKQN